MIYTHGLCTMYIYSVYIQGLRYISGSDGGGLLRFIAWFQVACLFTLGYTSTQSTEIWDVEVLGVIFTL